MSMENKDWKGFEIKNNILIGTKFEIKNCGKHIGQIIYEKLGENPNDVGQIDVDSGQQTTNSQMLDQSVRVALWLKEQAIGKNDVVALSSHNHPKVIIPVISSLFVGSTFNPWPAELSMKTTRHMMQLVRPKVMFSSKGNVEILTEAAKLENVKLRIIVFEEHPQLLSIDEIMSARTTSEVENFKVCEISDENDVAMILFSSGTTGLPKGVTHSYKILHNIAVSFDQIVVSSTKSRNLWYSLLYWISGTMSSLRTILRNDTRIIHRKFDPEATCKIIEQYQVNMVFLSPSDFIQLQKSDVLKRYKLNSLKNLLSGGSKITKDVIEQIQKCLPHVRVRQGYGMTEIGMVCAVQNDHTIDAGSIGMVGPNYEIRIFDEVRAENLGPNQEGEILIKTPDTMLGYHNNPTATKEIIDADGWVHSGDKGYYNERGEIFITDRIKEMMKFRGYQVTPSEIEAALLAHPEILLVAVVPVPHEVDVERPMAFVKKAQNSSLTEEDVVKMSEVLGTFKKLWGGVKFLEDFPLTASGKIHRKELKEMAKSSLKE